MERARLFLQVQCTNTGKYPSNCAIFEVSLYDGSSVADEFTYAGAWDRQTDPWTTPRGSESNHRSPFPTSRSKALQDSAVQFFRQVGKRPSSVYCAGARDKNAAPRVPLNNMLRARGMWFARQVSSEFMDADAIKRKFHIADCSTSTRTRLSPI